MTTDAPRPYGPTLPDLLGAARARALLAAVLVITALAAAAYLVLTGRTDGERFVRTQAPAFNLRHASVLPEVAPGPAVLAKFEARRGGLFLQSLTIRRLRLPAYRGAVSAVLPAYATRYRLGLGRRFTGFTALDEGKVRINGNPGYAIGFRARLGMRTLWGREILLLPDRPGARDGLVLTLLQTPAVGVHAVADVGSVGALKKPYRSLRFGSSTRGNQ